MSGAWEWPAERVRAHVEAAVPELGPRGAPERLTGGLLNVVWRVPSALDDQPVIAKIAPPFVAALPDVPLSQARQSIEAAALAAFDGGPLTGVASAAVRPPRVLHHDPGAFVLVMEDVGDLPHLGDALGELGDVRRVGETLGRFIGRLHAATLGAAVLARFDNAEAQRTRLNVQYRSVGDTLRQVGVPDAEALGAEAVALGERLLEPGRCLIQGDLWPPSILVRRDGALRLIDWELAHAGVPAQDLGHLLAHLWMIAHRQLGVAAAAQACTEAFLSGYAEGAGTGLPALLADGTREDAARHAGCEVLVRTIGPFRNGSLYDGAEVGSRSLREAVAFATGTLRQPARSLFGEGLSL